MATKNSIDAILEKEGFSEKEKKAFHEMVSYAKFCQKGSKDNLKSLIEEKVKEIANNEVSEH